MPNNKPHVIENGIELKQCTKCNEYRPLDEYIKSKSYKDGFNIYCNKCRVEKKKQSYLRNKEHVNKKCLENYYKNHEENLKRLTEYRENNRGKLRESYRKWNSENKEKKREKDKKYKLVNKERLKLLEKIRMSKPENKARHNVINRKYSQTENGKINYLLCRQRYMSREKQVAHTFTREEWAYCKDRFANTCAYCGKKLHNLTQDHFVPLSKGGGYELANIIPCCKPCNSSKQDRDFFIWYPEQPFYNEERKNKIIEYLASV